MMGQQLATTEIVIVIDFHELIFVCLCLLKLSLAAVLRIYGQIQSKTRAPHCSIFQSQATSKYSFLVDTS